MWAVFSDFIVNTAYILCEHQSFQSPHTQKQAQGFFSKFLMGGDSKFSVPDGDEVRWGGTCEKNPTEAKNAHLMQN